MNTDREPDTTVLTADVVTDALRRVPYPGLTRDLVSFGMVEHVEVHHSCVRVRLGVHTRDTDALGQIERSIASALHPLGATSVTVQVVPPKPTTALPLRPGTPDPWADQVRLSSVRHVIAVGAGKGGVGKSTVAVNLALA